MILHAHPHNQPWGIQCDIDLQGQGHIAIALKYEMNSFNIQTIGWGEMSGCQNVTLTSNIKVFVQMHLINDMAKY